MQADGVVSLFDLRGLCGRPMCEVVGCWPSGDPGSAKFLFCDCLCERISSSKLLSIIVLFSLRKMHILREY